MSSPNIFPDVSRQHVWLRRHGSTVSDEWCEITMIHLRKPNCRLLLRCEASPRVELPALFTTPDSCCLDPSCFLTWAVWRVHELSGRLARLLHSLCSVSKTYRNRIILCQVLRVRSGSTNACSPVENQQETRRRQAHMSPVNRPQERDKIDFCIPLGHTRFTAKGSIKDVHQKLPEE